MRRAPPGRGALSSIQPEPHEASETDRGTGKPQPSVMDRSNGHGSGPWKELNSFPPTFHPPGPKNSNRARQTYCDKGVAASLYQGEHDFIREKVKACFPPSPGVWDAILSAGGPSAALAVLARIGESIPAKATLLGSAWDASNESDATHPHHLSEWVDESGCHPALAATNVVSLQGAEVLQALAGDRLHAMHGWAHQYATGRVSRLLRPLEPIAEGGGWWCSG